MMAKSFPIVPRKRLSAAVFFFFVYILDSISPRLSSQEQQQLAVCYSNYVRVFFPERTTTVLHAAAQQTIIIYDCGLLGFRVTSYLKPIKLILKLGADPTPSTRKDELLFTFWLNQKKFIWMKTWRYSRLW
jgi:hypothetical protein